MGAGAQDAGALRHDEAGGSVTIYLEGRIDAANAEDVGERIDALLGQAATGRVTLDAEDLAYISSAGLRVVVRLLRRCAGLAIANASPTVYDVLQMTGITEMMPVARRPRELSLEGLPQIGAGAFGRVYRLDAERVVKVYDAAASPLEAIERERRGAREAFAHGIPSMIAFETVRAADGLGIVYELVDARTIGEAASAEPDRVDEFGRRMAELALTLHGTHFEAGALPDARLIFHGWVDRAEASGLYADAAIARLRQVVDDIPVADTFVHGDFHPANIMVTGDELTLIDMGDASMGDPVIDLAGAYHVVRVAAARPGGAERLCGMSGALLGRLWEAFLRRYYELPDGADLAEVERRLRRCALPRTMGSIARSPLIDDETRARQAREAERLLLEG